MSSGPDDVQHLRPLLFSIAYRMLASDYGCGEIAAIVGKSQDNCRQLAVRARRRIVDDRPRFETSAGAARSWQTAS